MAALLLLLSLSSSPVEARFLLSQHGVPLAMLEVSLEGPHYHYRSTFFLPETDTHLDKRFTLDAHGERAGLVPEVLALLRPPPLGCRPVLEERREEEETLCVDSSTATLATGSLGGVRFSARYGEEGLVAIELPGARWVRHEGRLSRGPTSEVFSRGFPVEPGAGPLRLEPPLGGTRLVASLTATGRAESGGRRRCLLEARAAMAGDPSLTLALGLVVERGRAYPHAWVRRGARDEDPSVLPSDEAGVEARRYLELPRELAGRAYLELLDGTRRVVGAGVAE